MIEEKKCVVLCFIFIIDLLFETVEIHLLAWCSERFVLLDRMYSFCGDVHLLFKHVNFFYGT